jgi:glycosyltransferase involved in cell wall biosynthesis
MKKALALSLIIPAYNEEQHLKDCLDSVASQTQLPDEVIVVDNNSTDRTVEIAKSYPFVRLLKAKQQGIVYARNAGFNAARSNLIGRIDADSVLPPNWVEEILAFYTSPEHHNSALTGGGTYYNVPFPHLSRLAFDFLAFRVNRIALGHHFLYGSNMVLPQDIWRDVKKMVCVRTDIHEDVDLAIHVHELGYQIVYRYSFQVGTKLRRVFQDHDKLWAVLMLWPQTYRVHGKPIWVTGWIGAILLYILTPLIYPFRGLQLLRFKLFGHR